MQKVAIYPLGSMVKLNSGKSGIVVKLHEKLPGRPVVRVVRDENRNDIESYYDLDMLEDLTAQIVEVVRE